MNDSWQQHEFVDHRVITRLSRLSVLPRGLVEGSFAGMHRSPHHGASVEFAEYRKYVPGDDIRHIDWRAYAKTDRYYLKEFEADTNMRLYIVVDCSASMNFSGEHGSKFEYARKLAATLAYLTIHQGDHVGLQAFNEELVLDIPPHGSPTHLKAIFDTLGEITPKGKTDVAGVLHTLAEKFRRRALVIVISDLFTDLQSLMDSFHHMRFCKHDIAVFHLLDPQEIEFDFDRPIRFQDLESKFSLVTEPGTIQNDYRSLMDQYMKRVRKGCTEHGADYQVVSTDQHFEEVLCPFLLERVRR
ncbi:hypothetical protein BVY04_01170 [bacterium M21]|nr:hypothetical protein BVY04_01170 [bacterium M21]